MNYRNFLKSAIDGILQVLGLECLLYVITSKYTENVSLDLFIIISILEAVLLATVYLFMLIKELNNKNIVIFSLCSSCCFVLCTVILFIIRLIFSGNIFTMRELNNADGILIIFATVSFILSSVFLRLCVFIVLLIKNRHTAKIKK